MENAYRRVARRFAALLAVASCAALLLVAPASAATSAQQGYSPVAGKIEQATDPVSHVTTNQLPFTGLDVLAIVAVGAALLAVGVGVRKLSAVRA